MKTLPKVNLIGLTVPDYDLIMEYLEESGQTAFMDDINDDMGSPQGQLTSMNAKLCYRSLDPSKNPNLTGARSIAKNLAGILSSAHGSVLEHVSLNFVIWDVSRVFTHELVRHRVGTAFSQTSGRYCAIDPGTLGIVWDPILNGCEDIAEDLMEQTERAIYLMECKKGIRCGTGDAEDSWDLYMFEGRNEEWLWPRNPDCDFTMKKQLTSAFRRFAPNGQPNEIGFTANIRTLRHLFQVRTSVHAEWEIRMVFCMMWHIVSEICPELFADAVVTSDEEGDLFTVSGMKMLPYS